MVQAAVAGGVANELLVMLRTIACWVAAQDLVIKFLLTCKDLYSSVWPSDW